MKKLLILFISVLALIFASCKSTPAPEEAPVEEKVEEVVEEVKENVEEVVETEKVSAEDFSGKNQLKLERLEKARKAAVAANVPEILPEPFEAAEKIYKDRKPYIEENFAKESFAEEIDALAIRYEAMAEAAQLYSRKQKIDELGLVQFDKADYEKGEAAYAKLIEQYNANASYSDLLATAKAGNEAYSRVLAAGLNGIAKKARVSAIEAKKKADSVYAGVAEKTKYKSYADKIVKADSDLVTKNPEAAAKGYNEAAASFLALYESVSKKRAEAQAKIEKAKAAVEKSQDYATEADSIAPLKEAVAGIEDENSTLLEEDNYKDPESAVIDVDNTDVGKAAAKVEDDMKEEAK